MATALSRAGVALDQENRCRKWPATLESSARLVDHSQTMNCHILLPSDLHFPEDCSMRAHEIMSRHIITISADASVAAAVRIMLSHHISGLPVTDAAGKLVGILSESDFLRRVEIGTEKRRGRWLALLVGKEREALDFAQQHGRKVSEIMSPNPITVGEDTSLDQIVQLMESHNVKRFPVMRGEEIVGMVTRTDFLAAIANRSLDAGHYSDNDKQIREAVIAEISRASWRPCALNASVHEGVVVLRGTVKGDNARKAAIVAAENIRGVKRVEDRLSKVIYPPPEEDYGGGDFVSLQEESSTVDDEPL
jgi:CBS domain-containing protein